MHLGKSGINPQFWHNKKIFITGHTGFKGSWLSLWLQKLQANVVGFALAAPTSPNLFELACVTDGMVNITGDVRDLSQLQQAVATHQPDIIFHLAAQPLVQYSYQNPVETYATNVMGTVHLLEAARTCDSVKVIVNITSDKCYENKEWDWGYRENDRLGGFDPYSNSKGCSELVTAAYRNSYFNPQNFATHGKALASARAGNVIGGGDWGKNRLIPDIIDALIQKKPICLRNAAATRPWQYILEPLSGYLQLTEKLWEHPQQYAEGWNFGPHDQDVRPVQWLVEKVSALWGRKPTVAAVPNMSLPETQILRLDISKARKKLAWTPRTDLDYALKATVNWYKAWQEKEDLHRLTMEQIQNYENFKQDK